MPPPPEPPAIPLAAMRDAAFLYGPDGVVRAATPTAEQLGGGSLAGTSAAELLLRLDARGSDGRPFAPADLPECRSLAGESAPDRSFEIAAADGMAHTILASASPIVEGGRIAGAFSIWRDVSECERVGEALAESDADARSFMENLVDACAICETVVDERGEPVDIRLVDVNPAFSRELCLPAHLLIGQTAFMILPALGRSWFDLFIDVSRTREAIEVEEPFPALGRWYHVTGFPVRRGRIAVVFRDISEQRRTEDALRASAAKYRRLFDDDITGNFIAAPDGRILDCNPAFVRMFGFASVEEARAGSIAETYISDGEREALLDRLRTGRRLESDERFRRRRDGTRIHVVENIIGDFDDGGNLVETRGYIIEDTRRYRAEKSLQRRERTLRGIFRAAPVGIGMVSNRTITQANDQLCRMTGYERGELLGQGARLLYPDDEAYAYVGAELVEQIAANGLGAVETQWRRSDGTVFDVLLTFSGVDPAGSGEEVILIALDITQRHESERALAVYAEELKQSNEELQRFAYVASHDLQEPLRAIVSFGQLFERRYKGRLDDEADEFIGFIVEGGMRLQALIRDLLQLSRVETQARPPVPIGAGGVVADVIATLEAPNREAGATITVSPMPTVIADPVQLEQVFMNLIANALKYHREGMPPVIEISASRSGRRWEFEVRDNGIGIAPEYFDRIFQMFQRLHTADEYEGTGIGLAVVKKIVERHGGRVWVESTPGEGSTFFFTLRGAG